MSSSDRIAEALFEIVASASLENQNELRAAIQDWSGRFSRTYHDVKKQPFARKMIMAMEEGLEVM